ncbi:mucin-17-like isoform X2 [Pomacea canaliculata]|uniref:mucin-17-like isoform X2 n=1 Tax=Pomacea canaliculata TaxID=400727 RepID=UPI000D73A39A|nr:mucin-17-like isoform X2 [Pomacea canaliculata]
MKEVFRGVIVFLLGVVLSSPIQEIREDDHERELVNVQLLRHHSDHRVRREAGVSSMPDVIVTQFRLSDNDVILRLRRVPHPKMYTFGDSFEEYTHSPMESSVYVDPSRSAAFMVARSGYGDYILEGNLHHKGKQLYLRPTRSRRSADDHNEHAVSPLVDIPVIDFGDDYYDVGGTNSSYDGGIHRRKRQTQVTTHTIKITVVVDYSDYSNWTRQFPNDTMIQIRTYFTYIATLLRNIYTSVNKIDSSIDIKPVVTSFVVLTTPQVSNFSESVHTAAGGNPIQGRAFLEAFSNWISTQPNISASDHYMAFTGYDIASAVGIANKGTLCRGRLSVSIVEDHKQASVANTAAHELGHSINASHDGDVGCDNAKQFVMTPTFFVPPDLSVTSPSNLFTFSTCSVNAFKRYLNTQTCTLNTSMTTTSVLTPVPYGELITNLDLQCQVALDDPDSKSCQELDQEAPLASLCYGMLCSLQGGNICQYVLPFDGTPCGPEEVCQQGLCVSKAAATIPTTQVTSAQQEISTSLSISASPTTQENIRPNGTVLQTVTTPKVTISPVVTTPNVTNLQAVTTQNTTRMNAVTTPSVTILPNVTTPNTTRLNAVTTPSTTRLSAVTTPNATILPVVTTPNTTRLNAVTTPNATISPAVTTPNTTRLSAVTTPNATILPVVTTPNTTRLSAVTTPNATILPVVTTPNTTRLSAVTTPNATILPVVTTPNTTRLSAVTTPNATILPTVTTPSVASPTVSSASVTTTPIPGRVTTTVGTSAVPSTTARASTTQTRTTNSATSTTRSTAPATATTSTALYSLVQRLRAYINCVNGCSRYRYNYADYYSCYRQCFDIYYG